MIRSKGIGHGGNLDGKNVNENITIDKNNINEYIRAVLDAHNKCRSAHGVPPLKLNNELTKYSQKWADKLLQMKQMQHSPKADRPNYGENIYWASAKYVYPNVAVDSWYSEAAYTSYKYNQEPTSLVAGHFTQLIWKSSEYLGVGISSGDSGIFVVCNYQPQGNIKNKFVVNVPSIQGNH